MGTTPVRLADAGATAGVGGKARGLARLLELGERVPDGFVIPMPAVGVTDEQLSRALADLEATAVAVRSSGADEDGGRRSLAGAYATVLGVRAHPSEVHGAVEKVAASGRDVAVVVQAQVEPDVAGVAFSLDPVTGDDHVVLEAVPGRGEPLLAGRERGERWRVDAEATRIAGSASGALLSAAQAREVADVVWRVAEAQGHPVDVEWAFADGALHLLQCRPVTSVPRAPEIEVPPGPWEKDVAHFHSPLTPMGVSLRLGGDEELMRRWADRYGLILETLRVTYLGGECYTQVVPLGGSAGGAAPPWWLVGLLARLHPRLRRRMRTAAHVMGSGLLDELTLRWEQEWRPEFEALVHRFRTTDLRELDDRALLAHADTVRAAMHRGAQVHFDLFVPYLVGLHRLDRTCQRLFGWPSGGSLTLLSEHSPASTAPTRHLQRIAADVAADPDALLAVQQSDDALAALRVQTPDLATRLEAWLETDGFRATEYDVGAPLVCEVPGLVDGLLRSAPASTEPMPVPREAPSVDLDALRAGLSVRERADFDQALTMARRVHPVREDNVQLCVMALVAALRIGLLEAGRRLVERDLLDHREDVFFLAWEELVDAIGHEGPGLHRTVERRRAERAWVLAHPGPLSHGDGAAGEMPDLRGLPPAGRTVNEALLWAVGLEMSPTAQTGEGLHGTGVSPGRFRGPVRRVHGQEDFSRVRRGDVLVCRIAGTSWSPLLGVVGALVCESGGALSHAAVVAREHGVPAAFGVPAALTLSDGVIVEVDGTAGTVSVT